MKINRVEHNKTNEQYSIKFVGNKLTQILIIDKEQYESILHSQQFKDSFENDNIVFHEVKEEDKIDDCKIICFVAIKHETHPSYWMKIKRCFKNRSEFEIKDYEISREEFLMFVKDLAPNKLENKEVINYNFQ